MSDVNRLPAWRTVALILVALGLSLVATHVRVGAAETQVLVTSTGDSVVAGQSVCPSATLCTLRRAIEAANAVPAGDRVVIRFDAGVFDPKAPATIAVLGTPLPAVTRDNVRIDARAAGAVIDGTALAAIAGADGIVADADNFDLFGVVVRSFPDYCVLVSGSGAHIGGSRDADMGNQANVCRTGIGIRGAGATVQGNLVGLDSAGDPSQMLTGIEAMDGDAIVGALVSPDQGNVIGNVDAGVVFRASPGQTMTGKITGNTVGETVGGTAAPVTTGVRIVAAAGQVEIEGNHITNATTGVTIAAGGVAPSTGNTIRANRFENVARLGIDLGGDGRTVNNPVSPGGAGPNQLLSYPEINRAVQGEITGRVPGPCAGCTVDFYLAERRPDDRPDVPTVPVMGASTVTNAAGEFTLANPPVTPGQWLMAIATDAIGNTSEFSDAILLGTGIVQCGNATLHPGWNAAGYFGASRILGSTFPTSVPPPGPVLSIHHLDAGTHDFDSWFADGLEFGSLSTLATGEPYWFYATEDVFVPGSITLAEPLPVGLKAGWNDFVYIGAPDTVASVLEGIAGKWSALYHWVNDGASQGWEVYGGPSTPEWARGFEQMQPCGVYQILMSADGTLTPQQP